MVRPYRSSRSIQRGVNPPLSSAVLGSWRNSGDSTIWIVTETRYLEVFRLDGLKICE